MRYLPLVLVILAACAAPPTAEQKTSRAVKRNCESQAAAAADDVRRQNAQAVKEGNAVDTDEQYRIETRASRTEEQTYKDCMLKYSV